MSDMFISLPCLEHLLNKTFVKFHVIICFTFDVIAKKLSFRGSEFLKFCSLEEYHGLKTYAIKFDSWIYVIKIIDFQVW